MANINLDELSLEELKQLQKDVERAINSYQERKRKEALAEAEEVVRKKGFTLAELTGGSKKKTPKLPQKYAHPNDPNKTWSGRGRRPKWVVEALEAGKKLDDLLISRK